MRKFVLFLICFFAFSGALHAQELSLQWLDQLKTQLNFTPYYNAKPERRIRVAIFDQGFAGYKDQIGVTLPSDTKYFAGPVALPKDQHETNHGLMMAEIFVNLVTNGGKAPQFLPELTLFNTFSYSNLESAVTSAIANHIDMIVEPAVFDYGSNNNGEGFYNAVVNRATDAGIIWINSAGNAKLTTYNVAVKVDANDWIHLPERNNSLSFKCESEGNPLGECAVRIILSWNDFKNDLNIGTDKDLDLELDDDQLNIIQTSCLRQTKGDASQPGYSKYPREIINAVVKPGVYSIRVKKRGGEFSIHDEMRITVNGDAVSMTHYTPKESISNPADNPNVITVGAKDTPNSSMSVRNRKPEVVSVSEILLEGASANDQSAPTGDGEGVGLVRWGSSTAAVIFAAGAAILKSLDFNLTRTDILNKLDSTLPKTVRLTPSTLTTNQLGFTGTGDEGCFETANYYPASISGRAIFSKGAMAVQTTHGLKFLTGYDPAQLLQNQRRQSADDAVIVTDDHAQLWPRQLEDSIPQGQIEVFQLPQDGKLCATPVSHRTEDVVRNHALIFKMP